MATAANTVSQNHTGGNRASEVALGVRVRLLVGKTPVK